MAIFAILLALGIFGAGYADTVHHKAHQAQITNK